MTRSDRQRLTELKKYIGTFILNDAFQDAGKVYLKYMNNTGKMSSAQVMVKYEQLSAKVVYALYRKGLLKI